MIDQTIATLPPTAHVGFIRKVLTRERGMRIYAKIKDKEKRVAEIDSALESLDIIEAELRRKENA